MARPLLSVIIPTIGRPDLGRTLRSLDLPHPAVEVLVVGDTFAGTYADDLAPVPALCARYGATYLAYDGGLHAWGQPQRTAGDARAQGRYLWHLQDDTIATAPAVEHLLTFIASQEDRPPVPALWRVDTWQAGPVWREPELRLGNCDADGILVPNDPARLPPWPAEYNGDYAFLTALVAQYAGALLFLPTLIAIGRPERRPLWPDWLVPPGLV